MWCGVCDTLLILGRACVRACVRVWVWRVDVRGSRIRSVWLCVAARGLLVGGWRVCVVWCRCKARQRLYVGVCAALTFLVCCVGRVCLCVVDWWVNVRRVLWAAA